MSEINVVEPGDRTSFKVTIADGETESDWVNIGACSLCGLETPSNFSGAQLNIWGKTLSPPASGEGADSDAIQAGSGKSFASEASTGVYAIGANEIYPLTVNCFAAWRIFKVVSNTSQSGDCEIILKTRRVGL